MKKTQKNYDQTHIRENCERKKRRKKMTKLKKNYKLDQSKKIKLWPN